MSRIKTSFALVLLITMLFLSLILTTSLPLGLSQTGTNVSSIISTDTTWIQANSPYILSGPTLVSTGVTLTIQPGTTVNLGTYYLEVNGTLNARGTSIAPIHINSAAVNAGQIEFTAFSTSWNKQSGSGCIIENAIINQTVISTTNCSVKISGNIFNDNADMMHENVAVTTNGGSSVISNNYFNGGLDVSDSSTISNNTITGGMGIYGGSPVISKNTISGGSSYFFIGRDWDRDYNTIAIERQCSPTLTSNTIDGSIAFNMNNNGYEYNIFNALITSNTINGGIAIGGGSGTVVISNNILSGSGITANSGTSTTITNNLIINVNIGIQIGDATVQNNTIANSQIAISLNSAVSPTIIWNNIENSSQYNVKLTSTSNSINASNNWWGTTDAKAINQSIYDLKDDFNLGTVNFVPLMTEPNPLAPNPNGFVPTLNVSFSPTSASSSSPTSTPTTALTPTIKPTSSPTATLTTTSTTPHAVTNSISIPATTFIAVLAVLVAVIASESMLLLLTRHRKRPNSSQ